VARILVIEDDPGVRDLLEATLSRAGHEVWTASDGNLGLALFRAHPAALVITDILMPEQEGLETIQKLRLDNPDLKIIAISGAPPDWKVLHVAEKLGAHRTLAKPFVPQDIYQAVEDLLKVR
jgi:DNA-binding NtrC family response regulator